VLHTSDGNPVVVPRRQAHAGSAGSPAPTGSTVDGSPENTAGSSR
jgi:hypothetical protein